jgi:Mg/Co/Ni transporter MgtE
MSYRVSDWLDEHKLPAKKLKAIEEMTEDQALAEVLEAAERWDSEVDEYIFQELNKDEQKGYALASVRYQKAVEIVSAMIKSRRAGNEGT